MSQMKHDSYSNIGFIFSVHPYSIKSVAKKIDVRKNKTDLLRNQNYEKNMLECVEKQRFKNNFRI